MTMYLSRSRQTMYHYGATLNALAEQTGRLVRQVVAEQTVPTDGVRGAKNWREPIVSTPTYSL